jgi:hypothetical protein
MSKITGGKEYECWEQYLYLTYIYDAHTYHTKVPPQGIKPLIECIP